ncbi:MAG TPA: hypothetical protein VEL76_29520 [Gemmataceae bacterium]|nr:hypothetical protein [Gemmataceae bacterium]
MKRLVRRLAWVGIAACVVALSFGLTNRVLDLSPGVTRANFERLRRGMGEGEVAALLGGPGQMGGCYTLGYHRWWTADDAWIRLSFSTLGSRLVEGEWQGVLVRGCFTDKRSGVQEEMRPGVQEEMRRASFPTRQPRLFDSIWKGLGQVTFVGNQPQRLFHGGNP